MNVGHLLLHGELDLGRLDGRVTRVQAATDAFGTQLRHTLHRRLHGAVNGNEVSSDGRRVGGRKER